MVAPLGTDRSLWVVDAEPTPAPRVCPARFWRSCPQPCPQPCKS